MLSVMQLIGVCSRWRISPNNLDRWSVTFHEVPLFWLIRLNVLLLIFLEFYVSREHLLWMLVRKISPPWLPSTVGLLKMVSVYTTSWIVFGSRLGKRIWFFWFLTRFTTLFSSMTTQIFMLLTLVLMLHVLKLLSGLEIPDNQ